MIYNITKSGNWGKITPLPEGSLAKTLDKYLQYERQGKQFMPNPLWALQKLYHIKTGVFPWGLLSIVRKIMNKYEEVKGISTSIDYKPTLLILEKIRSDTLRDYQNDAVAALIKHNGGILCLPTGSGKTITIVEYLKLMNRRSLVLCPTKDIRKQWQDYNLYNLTPSTYQNPKLRDKTYLDNFDIIIFDECHHVSAKTLYNLAMKTKTNTILIGISATTKREDGEDMKITAALGGIVYTISRTELIKQGWISNAKVYYLRPTFTSDGKYLDYQQVYKSQIVLNTNRNKLVIDTAFKEYLNSRKILILVSQVEHGQILYDRMIEIVGICNNNHLPKIIFMNGKSKDRDQDMSVYDIIIATSIYDEGYNLPSLDCIILAGAGKSGIKLTQRIGRVLRPKLDGRPAHIYDFIDGIKFLRQHYLKRRKLLELEFEIVEDQQILAGG